MNAPNRLRAPQDDGAVLTVPSLSEIESLVTLNRRLQSEPGLDFFGRSWSDLRGQARREALQTARDYFAENGEPIPPGSAESLVLAGHQPELFHPGVWVKNFALQNIAHRCDATPLALIVDNDTVKSTALRLPSADTSGSWHRAQLPFDFHGVDVPYEERTIHDVELFRSLPERATSILGNWGFDTILAEFWRKVLEQQKRTPLIGECFAAARRSFERRWGCHSLEVPVSRLSTTDAFAWFACHVLSNLEEFHTTYNGIVQKYRQANRIRSRNHPVPDLLREGDWLEAPFWAWRTGERRRGRLFASSKNGQTQLRTGEHTWNIRSSSPDESWRQIADAGFKIRSRALTTTLYARLMLADLFVHGIGGAKYDELTDELIKRFYKIEPPAFAIVSGTLLLPFPRPSTDQNGCAKLKHKLRDLWYNPQRHLPANVNHEVLARANEKLRWIETACSTPQDRKERFARLRALSAALRPALAHVRDEIAVQAQQCDRLFESQNVLIRRDYPFCLFPEEKLRSFCRQLLP